ncbi:MAG: hypothetical protein IKF71_01525 [Bacilli bacterium]|nr:hypothetical protein [Bacilli bacterium]
MRILNKIRLLLWILVFFGAATAYVDYQLMQRGELPVFCKVEYNQFHKKETFRGIFYVAERTIRRNPSERLSISSDIQYRFLNQVVNIRTKPVSRENEYVMYVTPSSDCPNDRHVYQELEGKKVFIECISSLKLKNVKEKESKEFNEVLSEKPTFLNDLLMKMSFTGIDEGGTERYVVKDPSFTTQTFYLYQCHNGSNRDVTISLNSEMYDICK